MNSVCIIPARGGSKRIPRKNVREFLGKPIIAYSIGAALSSGLFDEVMVSTDDDEIADIAKMCGAEVPFMRTTLTSNDSATTAEVIKEVLARYQESGRHFESICCLYATAPFVTSDELSEAAEMIERGAKSVIPVSSFDFPPLRAFRIGEDGGLEYAFPEYALMRSQDLPTMVHDCGRFYFARTDAFLEYGSFLGAGTRALMIPNARVQDIDTLEDWEIAEQKYSALVERRGLN